MAWTGKSYYLQNKFDEIIEMGEDLLKECNQLEQMKIGYLMEVQWVLLCRVDSGFESNRPYSYLISPLAGKREKKMGMGVYFTETDSATLVIRFTIIRADFLTNPCLHFEQSFVARATDTYTKQP